MDTMLPATLPPGERITDAVMEWPGVTAGMGSHGELSFKVDRKENGHLHGDSAAHFFFDKRRWAGLMAAGRIVEHPMFPGKWGPAARPIQGDEDVLEVIALMRMNYEAHSSREGDEG